MSYKRNCEIRDPGIFPAQMQRIALGLEYNGSLFKGFQKQNSAANTVQAAVEHALSSVANETITIVCAGRTDAGVHATNQVVHFDTLAHRPNRAWIDGVNTRLPDGVRVCWSQTVAPEFHARFSALSRTYRYLIYSSNVRPAILQHQLSWTQWRLDSSAMNSAAQALLGERDFSSFRASQCQSRSPIREIFEVSVKPQGELIILEIEANAFLYHMVRNIVGALMEVGRGAKDLHWFKTLIELGDRNKAPATASPQGLYLVRVAYPAEFGLPGANKGPLFIQD